MYIEIKPRRGRNDRLYIFNFKDQADADGYIDNWLALAEENQFDEFKDIVLKLKNRIDGKYATENSQLSGLLFEDEFAAFTTDIIFLSRLVSLQKDIIQTEMVSYIFNDEKEDNE
jgi:hypothetical protein